MWQLVPEDLGLLLPHVAGSLIVLVFGVLLGILASRVAYRLLRMADVDRRAVNAGVASSLETLGVSSTSRLLARIIALFVIFSSTIAAMYMLDSRLASGLAERFLLYIPRLAGALLILAGGAVVARFLSRSVLIAAVNREIPSARLLADATRVVVMALTIAIAFEQAQIGQTTILVAFAVVAGGITLAVAIAVGLAMREVVSSWLMKQVQTRSKPEHDVLQHL